MEIKLIKFSEAKFFLDNKIQNNSQRYTQKHENTQIYH